MIPYLSLSLSLSCLRWWSAPRRRGPQSPSRWIAGSCTKTPGPTWRKSKIKNERSLPETSQKLRMKAFVPRLLSWPETSQVKNRKKLKYYIDWRIVFRSITWTEVLFQDPSPVAGSCPWPSCWVWLRRRQRPSPHYRRQWPSPTAAWCSSALPARPEKRLVKS